MGFNVAFKRWTLFDQPFDHNKTKQTTSFLAECRRLLFLHPHTHTLTQPAQQPKQSSRLIVRRIPSRKWYVGGCGCPCRSVLARAKVPIDKLCFREVQRFPTPFPPLEDDYNFISRPGRRLPSSLSGAESKSNWNLIPCPSAKTAWFQRARVNWFCKRIAAVQSALFKR